MPSLAKKPWDALSNRLTRGFSDRSHLHMPGADIGRRDRSCRTLHERGLGKLTASSARVAPRRRQNIVGMAPVRRFQSFTKMATESSAFDVRGILGLSLIAAAV